MVGAELGLAIVTTVDLCLNYGRMLTRMCAAFRNADTELARRILRVKASWMRVSYHLDLLRNIAQTLPPEYLELQDQTLKVLRDKLEMAVSILESLVKKDEMPTLSQNQSWRLMPVERSKYALLEGRLNKAIDDLETWQGIFDPSWYLIIKAAIPQIDEELAKHVQSSIKTAILPSYSLRDALKSPSQEMASIWLREEGIKNLSITDILFSEAKLAQRLDGGRELILESILCPEEANFTALTRDVRDLARKLSLADPITFGLLNCKGVVQKTSQQANVPSSFTFVFRIPDGLSEPASLRDMLLQDNVVHSLSDQFALASQLAKSVCYIHTFGFVHKNVRPENILILKGLEAPIGYPYLVGFEHFRAAEGNTSQLSDNKWERNLYRHPRRQGARPEESYVMQHDIYSLGVCLLELGLWQSFVDYDLAKKARPSSTLGLSLESDEFRNPYLIKDHLLSIARATLPRRMGTKFAHVVETCLTCLDPDNTDFGDKRDFQDADGILVGVRYIEKVRITALAMKKTSLMSPRF